MTSSAAGPDLTDLVGSWILDAGATSVAFSTKALWILPARGTFQVVSGTGGVAADGRVQGDLVLDAASIDTHLKKRDKHLRSAEFLDVEEYPTITYSVDDARQTAADKFEIDGGLTVREQTRPLPLTVSVSVSGESATLVAEVDIDRRDWGVSTVKMGSGVLIHAVIRARFVRS